jgi:hypothetical protein
MSCVDRLLDVVITCTWLLVTSGTAPIDIWVREYNPNPIKNRVNKRIINFFLILNSIIRDNIIHGIIIDIHA